jgi:hypothetical protein
MSAGRNQASSTITRLKHRVIAYDDFLHIDDDLVVGKFLHARLETKIMFSMLFCPNRQSTTFGRTNRPLQTKNSRRPDKGQKPRDGAFDCAGFSDYFKFSFNLELHSLRLRSYFGFTFSVVMAGQGRVLSGSWARSRGKLQTVSDSGNGGWIEKITGNQYISVVRSKDESSGIPRVTSDFEFRKKPRNFATRSNRTVW